MGDGGFHRGPYRRPPGHRLLALGAALACLAAATASLGTVREVAAAPGDHVVTTIAGTLGEGPALSIQNGISEVAVSGSTLYATDHTYSVIRAVDLTTGHERTVAGVGSRYGFYGDGGRATAAGLGNPQGIAVDPTGNLLIADAANRRVRKVTPAGVITTFAGGGPSGTSGEGVARGGATSRRVRPQGLEP